MVATTTFNAPHQTPWPHLYGKKPVNSAVLVAATYKKLKRASDGTSTRVVAYIINKLRAKINQKRLFNVRDPPGIRRRFI